MVVTIFTVLASWTAIGARRLQLVCWRCRRCAAPFICCTRRLIPGKTLHSAAHAEHAVRREEEEYCGEDVERSRRDTEPAILARLALDVEWMVSRAMQQVSLLVDSSLNACCPHLQF